MQKLSLMLPMAGVGNTQT